MESHDSPRSEATWHIGIKDQTLELRFFLKYWFSEKEKSPHLGDWRYTIFLCLFGLRHYKNKLGKYRIFIYVSMCGYTCIYEHKKFKDSISLSHPIAWYAYVPFWRWVWWGPKISSDHLSDVTGSKFTSFAKRRPTVGWSNPEIFVLCRWETSCNIFRILFTKLTF